MQNPEPGPAVSHRGYGDLLTHSISQKTDTKDLYVVVKAYKRLFIQNTVTGELMYTPQDAIQLNNRTLMTELAKSASEQGMLTNSMIVQFEKSAPYRKNTD